MPLRRLLIFGLTLSSCATQPISLKHTVCVSDSDLVGMQCHDSRISDPEKADFLKIYSDTNGYVCRPPESEKLLMIYCKTPGH